MSGLLVSLAMLATASIVLWRALGVIDQMSRCTCARVRWSWIALAVAALGVACAVLTGDDLPVALTAFFAALGWVFAADRRLRPRRAWPQGKREGVSHGA